MKTFEKLLFVAILASFSACKNFDGKPESKVFQKREGKMYGGNLYVNEIEVPGAMYPHAIKDMITANMGYQIFEGLVRFNPKDLSVMPAIAESWTLDSSGTIYTFTLKKGVKFHDDPCFVNGKGREVTAADFVYCFELLCTKNEVNQAFGNTFQGLLKGADAYYQASATGKPAFPLEGVKALDNNTLQITLEKPYPSFLQLLCTASTVVFPKEAFDKYGNSTSVGTGPFLYVDAIKEKGKAYLVKNPNYYQLDSAGRQLPYLDSVIVSFLPNKSEELTAFRNDDIDIISGLPSESVNTFLSEEMSSFQSKPVKYVLERSPEMATNFYVFNLNSKAFKNAKVRQAFCYAIDRQKIVDNILSGQAAGPGIKGLVPPAFKQYPFESIKGYSYDPETAKKLMAEAGYPDGKGFETIRLEISSGGARNPKVALEIQKQLKEVLNVNIDFEVVSLAQCIEDRKYGRADLFNTSWIADFPSIESFLSIAYGKTVPKSMEEPSYPNTSRYQNEKFDELYEKGLIARDEKEEIALFAQADQIMINDAPIMVLWYDENYRVMNSKIQNFFFNPLGYKYYGDVYFEYPKAEVIDASVKN